LRGSAECAHTLRPLRSKSPDSWVALIVNETDARCFTLIRALEEADPAGVILPFARRRVALPGACPPHSAPAASRGAWLVHRARMLSEDLLTTHPERVRLLRPGRAFPWLLAGGCAWALVSGYVAAEFGSGNRLQLLSFPLVGLLVWNLVLYGLLAGGAIMRHRSRLPRHEPVRVLPVWLRAWSRVLAARVVTTRGDPWARFLGAFLETWSRQTARLRVAQMRQVLHAVAAALAIGLIAGLYVRGLVLEYRAGWESTFLDEQTLAILLTLVFGPASWLTGLPLPDAGQLAGLAWNAGTGGENAARWIHLAAVTAGLLIVAPRLFLFSLARRTAGRLRHSLMEVPDDAYTRRLLQAGSAGPARALLVPLGFQPGENSVQAIRELAAGLLGGESGLTCLPPVRYGDEDARITHLSAEIPHPPVWLFTLVNLAATPEAETQGEWLRGLPALVEKGLVAHVLVVADDAAYRAVLAPGDAERRLGERFAAWQQLAGNAGLDMILLNRHGSDPADVVAQARRHTFPSLGGE